MFLTKLRATMVAPIAIATLITGAGVLAQQDADPGAPGGRGRDRLETEVRFVRALADPAPAEVTESVVLRPFIDRAWYAIFSPDGKSLVAGNNTSGVIRVYDVA